MKKKYFLLISLVTCQLTLLSQSDDRVRIDSLKKVLPSLKDSLKVDCLQALSTQYGFMGKPKLDSMYLYVVEANKEAEKINYKYGMAYSMLGLAYYEIRSKSNIPAGEQYIRKSLSIAEETNDAKLLGRTYITLAEVYIIRKDRQRELENYKKALFYFQKCGDFQGQMEANTWLCTMYSNEGDYEKGFEYCENSLQLSQSTPIHTPASRSYWLHEMVQSSFFYMAQLYWAAGDYQTAMEYLRQCDQYAIVNNTGWYMNSIKSDLFCEMRQYDSALFYWHEWEKESKSFSVWRQATANAVLGKIYLNTKRYDEALKILKASNATLKEGNKFWVYGSLFLTAKTYVNKKDWKAALKNANEGFSLAKKQNSRHSVMEGYELLSHIYHELGKNDQAYHNLRQYTILKDSIFNRQFLWRLNSYKKTAEDEKKKASIELLYRDNVIKDEQLKQGTLLKRFILTGLLACILIGIFILRNLALKRKNEKIINEHLQNELTLHQLENQKKQAELKHLSAVSEMQGLRAQMNPHFIFNCLSSINSFILKNESEQASDYLTSFSRLIRMVLNNSRKPLLTLEEELEMMRLYLEMERLRFKNSFNYNITFKNEIDLSSICIPPLLFQPFAENAIRHGLMNKEGVGQLDISLALEKDVLVCTITDNGIGRKRATEIKGNSARQRKSMGLQITEERLAILKAQNISKAYFKIDDLYNNSGEATGTRVVLKFPVESILKEFDVTQDLTLISKNVLY